MTRALVVLVSLLTLVALPSCAAEGTWSGFAGRDSWTTPPGIPIELRVSKYGPDVPGQITAVALPASSAESPAGPAVAGTRLPVTLDGIACTVAVLGRTTETVARSRPDSDGVRRTTPAGTIDLQFLSVQIDCGDHPVPGTDASHRGARSRSGTAWAALFLVLAVISGALLERSKPAVAALVIIVGLVGAGVLPFVLFESAFRITYGLLFLGVGALGLIGMRGDSLALRIVTIAGIAVGCAIAPLIWPLWTGLAPVMALVFAIVGGALGAVAVVLKS